VHLVHVIYHLGIGGGEVFLADLAVALAPRGIRQQVFCIGPAGPLAGRLRAAGVRVTALGKRTAAGVVTIARLAAALRSARPDVVQLHGEAGLYWGLPAATLAGAPHVVSLVYQNYPESKAKMRATRLLLPRAHAVIAGSESIRVFAVSSLGAPASRTHVVHCGIDVEAFTPREPLPIREAAHARRLVTVGRLVPRKGHAVAIEALAEVVRARPDAELVIVGEGPERAALERLAGACGLSRHVSFAGIVWPTREVLRGADLFLFPSLDEPQGLALLEAAAIGVPIVASRTGGIPEMVDESSAVLVPPGDAEALASAVVRLLADPARRTGLAAEAARRVHRFDIRAIARRYEALYSGMIAPGAIDRAQEPA
jgi:glycosyltransferase involved in cell wall biosynthesis